VEAKIRQLKGRLQKKQSITGVSSPSWPLRNDYLIGFNLCRVCGLFYFWASFKFFLHACVVCLRGVHWSPFH
jgi:hypothetical protein